MRISFFTRDETPTNWRRVRVCVMPKAADVRNLSDTRLLVMQNALSRLYSTCIVILIENHFTTSQNSTRHGIYGFKEGRKCYEISGALKALAQTGDQWGKSKMLHVANADIKQAFDHCTIDVVQKSMDILAIPKYLQHALLEPLLDCTCDVLM